jgi:hypothetical protein
MYKHLDEQVMTEHRPGVWISAIPLPYYLSRMLFKTTYQCGCGEKFNSQPEYELHVRTEQMLEMNHSLGKARDMAKIKAIYWRRRSFVLEHGDELSVREVKLIETPEMKIQEDLMVLLARVTDVWGPVYREWAEHNDITVGHVKDETTLEDETPEEAKQ